MMNEDMWHAAEKKEGPKGKRRDRSSRADPNDLWNVPEKRGRGRPKSKCASEFAIAKAQLKALQEAEAFEPRRDEHDKRVYDTAWMRRRREQMLPRDRRCPLCAETKVKTRSWTIFLLKELLDGAPTLLAEMLESRSIAGDCETVAICTSCCRLRGLKKTDKQATHKRVGYSSQPRTIRAVQAAIKELRRARQQQQPPVPDEGL